MALISADPIIIDESGYALGILEQRQRILAWTSENLAAGREAGGVIEQFWGNLVEHLVSMALTGNPIWEKQGDDGWDYQNPNGIKFDIKTRGGDLGWQDEYTSLDGLSPREGKHNLYARQLNNPNLHADAYIFCHLQRGKIGYWNRSKKEFVLTTSAKALTPMRIWIRGWISRSRCHEEQVFTPSGSISERGHRGWMEYRDDNIEVYDRHLNLLKDPAELNAVTVEHVRVDQVASGHHLHLTTVDACRIAFDLCERGVITADQLASALESLQVGDLDRTRIAPFLHANQYHAFIRYLVNRGIMPAADDLSSLGDAFSTVDYAPRR